MAINYLYMIDIMFVFVIFNIAYVISLTLLVFQARNPERPVTLKAAIDKLKAVICHTPIVMHPDSRMDTVTSVLRKGLCWILALQLDTLAVLQLWPVHSP